MSVRILFIGQNWHGSNATSLKRAFRALGNDVLDIDEYHYFPLWNSVKMRVLRRLLSRFIMQDFSNATKKIYDDFQPQLTFVFKGVMVPKTILQYVRREGSLLFNFYPDWDFGYYYKQLGNDFLSCMREYDIVFTPKSYHLERFKSVGVRQVEFLPYAYDPWCHFPVTPTADEMKMYASDVVFIGAWGEKRAQVLEQLASNPLNFGLSIWGNQWQKLGRNSPLTKYVKNMPAYGSTQAKIFASSRIALAFLTPPDLHTARSFEIPAYRAFMLAERTVEHTTFFDENVEIACFNGVDELKDKIEYYLANETERCVIQESGYQKVTHGGHSYLDRADRIMDLYVKLNSGNHDPQLSNG